MDDCEGCQALRAEAGSNAEHYARRLPVRGWAGTFTTAERAYLRAHPPLWYAQVLARPPGFALQNARSDATSSEDAQAGITEMEASVGVPGAVFQHVPESTP